MAKLEDLLRQRKLVASHLAWLDAEIAAQEGASAPHASAPHDTFSLPSEQGKPLSYAPTDLPGHIAASLQRHPVTPPGQPPEIPDSVTEEFLMQFEQQAKTSPQEAKKGCLVLFFSVVGLLAAALLLIYFLKYH